MEAVTGLRGFTSDPFTCDCPCKDTSKRHNPRIDVFVNIAKKLIWQRYEIYGLNKNPYLYSLAKLFFYILLLLLPIIHTTGSGKTIPLRAEQCDLFSSLKLSEKGLSAE